MAHTLVILGVTFSPSDERRGQEKTLDIVLVQNRTENEPEEAEYLAQANQEGGGESEHKARPSTPVPPTFVSSTPQLTSATPPAVPSAPILSEHLRDPVSEVTPQSPPPERSTPVPVLAQTATPTERTVVETSAARSDPNPAPVEEQALPHPDPEGESLATVPLEQTDTPTEEPAPSPEVTTQATQAIDATTLINESVEMASLSAEIDNKLRAYAQRPRRKWVTARTKQHAFAAYMQAWRAKVERFGNLNYPDEARRNRLSGSLLLDVALNADGSINEITLRRSSGQRVLDDAAIRIVKLAAPFARFPASFRDEVDILHIERTWQFLSSNQFSTR